MILTVCGGCQQLHAAKFSENNKALYTIVTPDKPSVADAAAAANLKKYLDQVTGTDFPVVEFSQAQKNKTQNLIYVGLSPKVRSLTPNIPWDNLKYDELIMKTVGNDLILAGEGKRGTLYAVYQFLEDYVGCEWWTYTESTIPSKPMLTIPAINVRYAPKIPIRNMYTWETAANPDFALKTRTNGVTDPLPPEFGGSERIIGWCHTFGRFIPPEQYYDKHPEWGALINGKRTRWDLATGQMCLSNEELQKEMTKVVLQQIEANPDQKMISVSINDNNNRCLCDKCLAIEKEEGSASGPLIRFLNPIAREVAKKHPDVLIHTLAYVYTVKPPKLTKAEKNIMIALCTYTEDLAVPYSDPRNSNLKEIMDGWAKMSSHFFIWDYDINFMDRWKPHPNWMFLGDNIDWLVKYKPTYFFAQAMSDLTQLSDFDKLRTWFICQKLWNPDTDNKKLMMRFLNGYYGKAGPYLYDYLVRMDRGARASDFCAPCNVYIRVPLDADTLVDASALMDKAAEAVRDNPVFLKRVKIERLSLDYLKLYRYPELRSEKGMAEAGKLYKSDAQAIAACDQFITNVKATGFDTKKRMGDWGNTEDYANVLKVRCGPYAPLPAFAKGKKVVDYVGGKLNTYYGYHAFYFQPDSKNNNYVVMREFGRRLDKNTRGEVTYAMEGKKWKVYAVLRYEGEKPTTDVEVGIFRDWNLNDSIVKKTITLKSGEGGGAYQTVEIGEGVFKQFDFAYVMPLIQNPESDDSIYIERILYVAAD